MFGIGPIPALMFEADDVEEDVDGSLIYALPFCVPVFSISGVFVMLLLMLMMLLLMICSYLVAKIICSLLLLLLFVDGLVLASL